MMTFDTHFYLFFRLLQEREIIVYCDLHGHSRKQNVFIYGCENRHNPDRRLRERIFPAMLHKNAPDRVCIAMTLQLDVLVISSQFHLYEKNL